MPPSSAVDNARSLLLASWPAELTLSQREQDALDYPFFADEVQNAIAKVDARASAGPDGIPYKVYKGCADMVAPFLARVLDSLSQPDCVLPSIMPHAWGVLLWKKKGDRDDLRRYRPLSIGSADVRIMSRLMSRRLDNAFQDRIIDEQTGFICKRSSIDNAFVLNAAIFAVRHGYCDTETLVLFDQDQEKAYDRVNHEWLFRVLDTVNVGPRALRFFKNLYHHPHVQFAVNGYFCAPLPIKRGVLQGDPSSCLLYILSYQPFMVHLKQQGIGIQLGSPDKPLLVTGAAFADNSMLFLSSHAQAEAFFQSRATFDLASESKLNPESATHVIQRAGSTQVPTWAANAASTVHWDPSTTEIKHLGRPLSLTGGVPVQHYKTKLEALSQFVSTMNSSQMHMFGRAQFINSLILPQVWQFCDMGGHPSNLADSINGILVPFLWRASKAFMPSAYAYFDKLKGGLGVIHINDMLIALTASWLSRILTGLSTQAQLCQPQITAHVWNHYHADTAILLARRGRFWEVKSPNLAHHHSSLWSRATQACMELNLSLPPDLNWTQITPLQAVALPFWMPEYNTSNTGRSAQTWRTYYTRAHQAGFYSFADSLH